MTIISSTNTTAIPTKPISQIVQLRKDERLKNKTRFLKKMYNRNNGGDNVRPRKPNSWLDKTPVFQLNDHSSFRSNNLHDDHHSSPNKKAEKKGMLKQLQSYCDKSTLHGLRYVGDTSLSIGERIFWLVAFGLAIGFATYYITNIYKKWNTSPVIISFSPFDTDLSTIPFPAITICNMNQAKKSEAEKILKYGSTTEKKLLNDYCTGNNTLEEYEETSWESLRNFLVRVGQSCADTMKLCSWRSGRISCEDTFNNDLTDEGLCCSFNRLPPEKIFRNTKDISILNQTYPSNVYDWNPEKGFTEKDTDDISFIPRRPLGAGAHLGLTLILDTQVDNYFCSSTHSVGFKILLANPIETPKMADFGFLLSPGTETRISITPTIKEATSTLRDISIEKRQCYFSNERPLQYYRTYSLSNCKLECEAKFIFTQCKCVPYYLPKNTTMEFCSKQDQECIINAKKENDDYFVSCRCLSACFQVTYDYGKSIVYLSKALKLDKRIDDVSKEYYVNNYVVLHLYFETTKFNKLTKRELYDFTDVLANTGALLSVFLGFSFLSLIEIFYYFLERCFFCFKYEKRSSSIPYLN